MEIKLFDSLSAKKQILEKPKGKPLRFFVCGPTVYDESHIGHARTYLVFDSIAKFLKFNDFEVFYLQNITDIDDKIIARAKKARVSVSALARKYLAAYKRDMEALGITAVQKYAPATKYIPQIVRQIQTLIRKGNAYEIQGDGYYFDVTTFPDYGKLSRRTAAQAEDSLSRIDESVHKRNKGDFALWKISKKGEPSWKTSLGTGRPGWHIEDTAITSYYFGPQYDVHGGAMDLKFPHHEAEIAQQESASGLKPFVKIWLHTGFLTISGEKMSKSLGNFVTIHDFLKKYPPEILRLMVLSYHYRSPINYSDELALENVKKWSGVLEFLAKTKVAAKNSEGGTKKEGGKIEKFKKEFFEALADDFNSPKALAALFSFISDLQTIIWEVSRVDAIKIEKSINETLKILGFTVKLPKIPDKIAKMALAREKSRRSKQFAQSDALRKKINSLGYGLDDTPLGPFVWPRS